ncbi:MAG: N-acetyltransferase [Clostridia bacterium]|nr:N-acetyltransferase [Clostridia bacterium]
MNKNLLEIKMETISDQYDVNQITKLAFGQTNECMLIERLREDASFVPELSLVAKFKGINIGHVLLTKVLIDATEGFLALAPVSVHPNFQRHGVGTMLIHKALETAEEMGYKGVIVLGHASYYPRFGFEKASDYNIFCPFEVPDEAFMIKCFCDMSSIKGTVIYPEAFSVV